MELITPTQLYWLTRLDGLETLSFALMVVGIVGAVLGFLFWGVAQGNPSDAYFAKGMKRLFSGSLIPMAFGIAGVIFIPTTKEMCAIYGIPAIVNNPQVQAVGTNTLGIAEIGVQYLKDKLLDNDKGK